MARSRGSSGKAGSRVAGKSRGKKPKGRQSGTRKRGGGRLMHAAPPWAIAGDDGGSRDDSQEQHDGADGADAEIGPQQRGIEAKAAIIAKTGMAGALELVGKAEDGVNRELGKRGRLEDVVEKANIPAGSPGRARRLADAQVIHVRSAGPKAILAAREAIEWVIAFTLALQEWVSEAEFYVRDMSFGELQDIITRESFRVLPGSMINFTAFTVNPGLMRYKGRQVTLRVRPDAIRGRWRITRYVLWVMCRRGMDIEWDGAPKSIHWADDCEVRLPDGTRVNLKGVYVTAYREMFTDEDYSELESKKDLLGGLEWA